MLDQFRVIHKLLNATCGDYRKDEYFRYIIKPANLIVTVKLKTQTIEIDTFNVDGPPELSVRYAKVLKDIIEVMGWWSK